MKAHKKASRHGDPTASAVTPRRTEKFSVSGLDCPSCAAEVRAALRVLDGIQAVAVNISGQEVSVTYDPTRLAPPTIRARLDATGYGCT